MIKRRKQTLSQHSNRPSSGVPPVHLSLTIFVFYLLNDLMITIADQTRISLHAHAYYVPNRHGLYYKSCMGSIISHDLMITITEQ